MTAKHRALPEKVNLDDKFGRFDQLWEPKIIGEINGFYVKIVKIRGEFVWHRHEREDELFLVIHGKMQLRFREHAVELGPGEMIVVPHGIEHSPMALEETSVLLVEPRETQNTGETKSELRTDPEWI